MYIEYMHVLNINSIASMRYSSFKTIGICFLYAQVEQFNHFMCCLAVYNTIWLKSLKKKINMFISTCTENMYLHVPGIILFPFPHCNWMVKNKEFAVYKNV